MNDDLELDFNSKNIKFKEEDILKYNMLTINDNIDRFKKFMYELTINEDFEKIFNTQVFQLTFLDDTSNYVENLVAVYNAIASNKLVNNRNYPTINEKEFIKQMELRGFTSYKTKILISRDNIRPAIKFKRNTAFLWK